jgi:hypothetical protein
MLPLVDFIWFSRLIYIWYLCLVSQRLLGLFARLHLLQVAQDVSVQQVLNLLGDAVLLQTGQQCQRQNRDVAQEQVVDGRSDPGQGQQQGADRNGALWRGGRN